jgi:hypothetical protein
MAQIREHMGLPHITTMSSNVLKTAEVGVIKSPLQVVGITKVSGTVTIDVLPEDVLLKVFNFHMNRVSCEDDWHPLVHVCQLWRYIVFASPRHLNLRLLCTDRRPVKTMLGIWPALPILVRVVTKTGGSRDMTNVVAALEEHNRVCHINIQGIPNSLFTAMERPFPVLKSISLSSDDETVPVLTDSFLGGSAPRLQSLELSGIPYPALPRLLLSTTDLVKLCLLDIPEPGYISPEEMVTVLSPLTKLQTLRLEFRSPRNQANRESHHPLAPPLRRTSLPSLSSLQFRGDSEYLEDIVAQIDAPLLKRVTTVFFNQRLFDPPLLHHFINRTKSFKTLHQAEILRQAFSTTGDC